MHLLKVLVFFLSMDLRHGPINLISLSLGKKDGFFNSLNFIKGSAIGYTSAGILVGFGRFLYVREILDIMKVFSFCSCLYITYIALCMIISGKEISITKIRQNGFSLGFSLNIINPFGWHSVLEGVSKFAYSAEDMARCLIVMLFSGLLSQGIWAYAGTIVSRYITSEKHQKIINRALGISLAASSLYLVIAHPQFSLPS